jgi:hypothetical protein
MIEKMTTLKPIGHMTKRGISYEMVLVLIEGYPACVVHIDTFWTTPEQNQIYSTLISGEAVECKMTLAWREGG